MIGSMRICLNNSKSKSSSTETDTQVLNKQENTLTILLLVHSSEHPLQCTEKHLLHLFLLSQMSQSKGCCLLRRTKPSPSSQRPKMVVDKSVSRAWLENNFEKKISLANYHAAVATININFVSQQNKREVIRIRRTSLKSWICR